MVFLSLLIYKHSVAKYMHFVQNTSIFFRGSAMLGTDEKGYLQIINLIISREGRTICAYLGKPLELCKVKWEKGNFYGFEKIADDIVDNISEEELGRLF